MNLFEHIPAVLPDELTELLIDCRGIRIERIAYREEVYLFATVLRLVAAVMFFGVIGFLAAPTYCRWATLPLPAWLRWVGVAIGILSAPLMYWTLSSLGKNLTDTVVTRAA